MASRYAELDDAILAYIEKCGMVSLWDIQKVFGDMAMRIRKENQIYRFVFSDEVISRRLQAMRKKGAIKYSRNQGKWTKGWRDLDDKIYQHCLQAGR
jgi:hypothetical protein